jgi:predicted short-subunit dehydrogenase-like oxidoreductase (DUF2520 family)
MSDQGAHVATDQETALYEAMTAGDWDAVEEMRTAAAEEEALDQFDVDYANAYAHYQADHEMPQSEREAHTADAVEDENQGRA